MVRYHRATGTRLPDDLPETHPDFIAAWARAEADADDPQARAARRAPIREGTIAAAIRSMRQGAEWKALSPLYQSIILRATDGIGSAHGTLPIAGIRRRHIEADLEKLDPNPANARLKAWRMLCRIAVRQGVIQDDPSLAVAKRRIRTDGHIAWSADDVAAFRSQHPIGTPARACFELIYWTAVRTCDAVVLSPAHVGTDGVLAFRQTKTGGMAHVPWSCPCPPGRRLGPRSAPKSTIRFAAWRAASPSSRWMAEFEA
ncbi:hypothetical protein [Paracoccus suum]|uniref:hypothetical protein n=1 Tax=Paracoccus suum TaxID=2259340 RepID=UPI001F53F898|nr:hypothetical protein [Paracoccus suum]